MVFAGQDAWRSHPVISNGTRYMFPGLRNAAIIFAGYLAVSTAVNLAVGGGSDHHHSASAPAGGYERSEGFGFKPNLAGADDDE